MPSPLLFLLASLIWGSTFWAITLQLGAVPPAVSVVYRFALAAATLFGFCLVRGDRLRLPWRTQRWLMVQGFLTFGLSYICTYSAEQYLVSAFVAVLFALMVFWTPLCSRLLFGTPIGWRVWAAGSVAVAGVILLFSRSIGTAVADINAGGKGHFLLGLALAVTATLASSAGNVVVSKVRAESANVFLTTAWSMAWGTALVLVIVLAHGPAAGAAGSAGLLDGLDLPVDFRFRDRLHCLFHPDQPDRRPARRVRGRDLARDFRAGIDSPRTFSTGLARMAGDGNVPGQRRLGRARSARQASRRLSPSYCKIDHPMSPFLIRPATPRRRAPHPCHDRRTGRV